MIYKLKAGSRVSADVQVVGETLEQERLKRGGFLRPEHVVEAAKKKRSPLHECFEWDDAKAAEAHRLTTASYILRSVVVVVEEDQAQKEVRAFVVVSRGGEDEQEYTSIHVAMEDEGYREQLLARAKEELDSWRRRYEDLEELAAVFAALDLVGVAGK